MTITIPRKILAGTLARLVPFTGNVYPWQRLATLSTCHDYPAHPLLFADAQNGVDFASAGVPCRSDAEPAAISVPLELLRSVVAASGDDEVMLSWDTKAVVVSDSRSRTRILADAAAAPSMPAAAAASQQFPEDVQAHVAGSRSLCDAIGAAAATAAPTDSRYAISAILVEKGKAVSTDGRVMQIVEFSPAIGDAAVMVPARLAAEISRWHAVDLYRTVAHVSGECDGEMGVWRIGTLASEHAFPPWQDVVPKETPPISIVGDASAIASAMRAAAAMCEEFPTVGVSVSGGRVEIEARGSAGEAKAIADAASEGEGKIWLNSAQALRLIKASGAIDDGPLEIRFGDASKPIVYRRGDSWRAVQMPTAGG